MTPEGVIMDENVLSEPHMKMSVPLQYERSMNIFDQLGGVPGILGGALNFMGPLSNLIMGFQNLEFQKGQQAYDKAMQERIMLREDTAVQRRVKDLEAAGLSKLLAASGSGAPISTPQKITTPQMKAAMKFEAIQKSIGIKNALLQLEKSRQDVRLAKDQRHYIQQQSDSIGWDNTLKRHTLLSNIEQAKQNSQLSQVRKMLEGLNVKLRSKEVDSFDEQRLYGNIGGASNVLGGLINTILPFIKGKKKAVY